MQYQLNWTICRVCLQENDEMCSIFGIDDDTLILNKLQECAGITINPINDLPEEICKKCLAFLNISYKFRITCRNSDELLKNMHPINDVKLETEEVEPEDPDKVVAIEWNPAEFNSDPDEVDDANLEDTKKGILKITSPKKRTGRAPLRKKLKRESSVSDSKKSLKLKSKRVRKKPNPKDKNMSLVCELCGNVYKKKSALENHVRWHRQEKPFICEICSMNFAQASHLGRHMRKHTGERPYACQYCGRKYSDAGTKQRHERTHTGERPYSCDVCGKTFSYPHALNVHKFTHTGEKRFRCDACGKGFTCAHHLKAHLATQVHKDAVNNQSKPPRRSKNSNKPPMKSKRTPQQGDSAETETTVATESISQQLHELITELVDD